MKSVLTYGISWWPSAFVKTPLPNPVPPVAPPEHEQRRGEGGEADDDPEALREGVVLVEPVDLRQPDPGQQAGHREQVGIGVRHGDPCDDVRRDIEAEEEQRVRERFRADDVLARDVDARERRSYQRPDEDEVEELSRAGAHAWSSSQRTAAAMIRSTASAVMIGRARPRRFGCSATTGTSTPESVSSTAGGSESSASAACVTAVSSGGASVGSKKTTVMLSSPPPRFAAPTSAFAASLRSSRCFSTARMIVPSSTMSVSPSEQMRKRSPGRGSTENVSTSTSGSVPTARVMTERCG